MLKKSRILFLSSYKVVNSLIVRLKSIGWDSNEYGMYLKLMSILSYVGIGRLRTLNASNVRDKYPHLLH